jgi:hypothetical protein
MTSDINLRTHGDPAVAAAYAKREKPAPCEGVLFQRWIRPGATVLGRRMAGASLKIAGLYPFARVRDWPYRSPSHAAFWRALAVCSTRCFGGLTIFLPTPPMLDPQVESVGLEVGDLVGGRYQDVQALQLTPWHRYALTGVILRDDAHSVVEAVVDWNRWRGWSTACRGCCRRRVSVCVRLAGSACDRRRESCPGRKAAPERCLREKGYFDSAVVRSPLDRYRGRNENFVAFECSGRSRLYGAGAAGISRAAWIGQSLASAQTQSKDSVPRSCRLFPLRQNRSDLGS